jgi:hypothetical protein
MVSRNDVPDAKEIFETVRHFGKDFLEHLYTAAEKDGNFLLPQEAIASWFQFLRNQPGRPDLSTGLTDLEEARLGRRLYRQLCDDAFAAYRKHTPGFQKRLAGAPRKDSLASEAAQLKEAGLSYAKIAVRLNQARGLKSDSKDYATGGSIRKLLKRREARQAPHPDKTQG